jgi:hypothetical protein
MSDFNKAVAIWLGEKAGLDPDKISNVNFTTGQGGYCETCEYTYVAIEYRYDGNYRDLELTYSDSPGDFVREVAEIASSL